MPEPSLYEVQDDSVVQAEDTNQVVRAVARLQRHKDSDPSVPFEGDVHFQGGTGQPGSLTHENTASRTWTLPDESGALALRGSIVQDHGGLNGLAADDHPQYLTAPRAEDWLAGKTTDDLAEGPGRLYHTSSRVRAALGVRPPLAYSSADGVVSLPSAGSGQDGYLSADDWAAFQSKAGGTHSHSADEILSGTLAVARGGTGLEAIAAGRLLYASEANVLAALALGSTLGVAAGVLEVAANSHTQRLEIARGGTLVGTRKRLNLVAGANVTVTVAEDAANDRVDVTIAAAGAGPSDLTLSQGRLTLVDGVPVPASDPPDGSTLYFAPFRGCRIALHDGSSWTVRTFAQSSLALSGLVAGTNYDVFAYWDSGTDTLKLELGPAWSGDNLRSTALGTQDGVPVKGGDSTRRWLGILRATSATQTRDEADQRFLFNAWNRVPRVVSSSTSTDSTRDQTSFAQVGTVGVQFLSDGVSATELVGSSVLAAVTNCQCILSIGDGSSSKLAAATAAFHAYNNGGDSAQATVHLREVPQAGFTERRLIFRSSTASNTATAYGSCPVGSDSPATSLGGLLLC